MLAPAITGVVILNFVIGLESFDVPLFLGTPVGIDVFATRIYSLIYDRSPEDYAGASALALLLVVLVVVLVYVQYRVLGRRTFTTVTGKGYRTEPWDIGGWRWLGTAFIVVFLLVAIVAPLVQLVLGSLQPFFGGGGVYSLVNFEELLDTPSTVVALRSTFLVALLGGLLAIVLALCISYAVTHSGSRLRRLLDMLTWLPWAVPGVVLALGIPGRSCPCPGCACSTGRSGSCWSAWWSRPSRSRPGPSSPPSCRSTGSWRRRPGPAAARRCGSSAASCCR